MEEQCYQFLSLYLSVQANEEQESVLEKGGGRPISYPSLTQTQQKVIHCLSSHRPPDVPGSIAPDRLPDALRANIFEVNYESLSELYDIDESEEYMRTRAISTADLISIYLRSFKNILEYDLSDASVIYERFLRYFSRVFYELVERFVSKNRRDLSLVCIYT